MERFGSRNRRDAITSRFRLRNYDYSTPGLYFVTICIEGRAHVFGHVADDEMVLNAAGTMGSTQWDGLPKAFSDVSVEHFVVMPNHVHAIVGIGLENPEAERRTSLPDAIHWYKSTSTGLYIKGVNLAGWPRFDGRLWQKGYHERVIRNDRELDRLWHYIDSNPARWHLDTFFD